MWHRCRALHGLGSRHGTTASPGPPLVKHHFHAQSPVPELRCTRRPEKSGVPVDCSVIANLGCIAGRGSRISAKNVNARHCPWSAVKLPAQPYLSKYGPDVATAGIICCTANVVVASCCIQEGKAVLRAGVLGGCLLPCTQLAQGHEVYCLCLHHTCRAQPQVSAALLAQTA